MATEQRPQIIELAAIQRQRPPDLERAKLVRRAQLLAWCGNVWHVFEFAVAIGAGVAAGSIALMAFGADSSSKRWPAASSSGGWRHTVSSPRRQSDERSG